MRDIKFNQQGIEAILNGSKTMTRRPVKVIDSEVEYEVIIKGNVIHGLFDDGVRIKTFNQPLKDFTKQEAKYKVGETVFIQEDFCLGKIEEEDSAFPCRSYSISQCERENSLIYKTIYNEVDILEDDLKPTVWQSASEMQEHQARFFLKIKSIKVEHLQDISEEDCIKEGVRHPFIDAGGQVEEDCMKQAFREDIWNNLPYEKPYDWNSNPCVFVYEFEVDEQ